MSDDTRAGRAPRARRPAGDPGRPRCPPRPRWSSSAAASWAPASPSTSRRPGSPTWSCSNRALSARGRPRSRWAGSGPRSPTRTTSSSGCGACARTRPSPTGSASTSVSARSATCSCAGPRPSWRRWRPASGCRTDSAATAAWSPPAEAGEINPMLDPGPLLGASFSPRDGYAEPARVVEGYARAAARSGSGAASTPRFSSSPPTRPVPIRSGPSGGASPPAR